MTRMEDWSDEQWQQYYDGINNGRKGGKHDEPLTPEDKEDVREYLSDPTGWSQRAKTKIQNKHWWQILGGSSSSDDSSSNSIDDAINNTDWS